MGLLRFACVSLAVTSACYSPETRDCSLQCTSVDDCAGDQQCGVDGFCVSAADIRCGDEPGGAPGGGGGGGGSQTIVPTDAGVPVDAPPDARPDAPPDAPTIGMLSLSVEGKGQLQVVDITWCSSSCVVSVPLGAPVTIRAIPGDKFELDTWTAGPCDDDETTCSFLPTLAISVGAKFRRED